MTRFDDLESLRKDTNLISLDHLTLISESRSNFHRKCYILDFRILTVILAVYLLGIAPTGEQCWRNARCALQGHCVTFKFRYNIIGDLHKSAYLYRLKQLNTHSPGGATLSDTITINFISQFRD